MQLAQLMLAIEEETIFSHVSVGDKVLRDTYKAKLKKYDNLQEFISLVEMVPCKTLADLHSRAMECSRAQLEHGMKLLQPLSDYSSKKKRNRENTDGGSNGGGHGGSGGGDGNNGGGNGGRDGGQGGSHSNSKRSRNDNNRTSNEESRQDTQKSDSRKRSHEESEIAKPSNNRFCWSCGKPDHGYPVCPDKDKDENRKSIEKHKAEFEARKAAGSKPSSAPASTAKKAKPSTQGKPTVKGGNFFSIEIAGDSVDNSDNSICTAPVNISLPNDVKFKNTATYTTLLDTCASHNLVSLSAYRKISNGKDIRLLREVEMELKSVNSTERGSYRVVELLVMLRNEKIVKRPLVFKEEFLVVDTNNFDIIICNRALKNYDIFNFLSEDPSVVDITQREQFEPEIAPEEADEMVADTSAFFEKPSAPNFDYKINPDFPAYDKLSAILGEHSQVFENPTSPMNAEPLRIDLVGDPFMKKQNPRRFPKNVTEEIDAEVDRLLAEGIIRPSNSSVAAPVVVARKPDGSLRMCVDYKDLNQWTIDHRYPMPLVKDCIERLCGKKYFAKLDLRWGFNQLAMDEDSKWLTAFVTLKGLYEFNRVPFGIKNAPSIFQQRIRKILSGLEGIICEVFIDDIIIYGDTLDQFLENVQRVLARLKELDVTLKASKCEFGYSEVEYLGHLINGETISLAQSRVQGIMDFPIPKSSHQLRRFLGMCNGFRDYIENYALITSELNKLTPRTAKFKWEKHHTEAIELLKKGIVKHAKLYHITYEHPLVLRTDASETGVGAVLVQIVDGEEQPIVFLSQSFSDVAKRWATIEQEAYGIFWAITKLEHYLKSTKFTLETDHRNLIYMNESLTPKVVRWRLRLQEFNFDIIHIPGISNTIADALSRCFGVKGRKINIPPAEIANLTSKQRFDTVHNCTIGHFGVHRTIELLKKNNLAWECENLETDVLKFIHSCPTCQKIRLRQGEMNPSLSTTARYEPFECLSVDTMGPFPADERGNKYIIVIIDCFSRFVELVAAPDATAESACHAMLSVVGRYGPPREIQSDNGPQYVAKIFENLTKFMDSGRKKTLAYRHESNGIVERSNQEVLKHLRAIVFDKRLKSSWSLSIPLVMRIMNSSTHSSTGNSPMRILFGDNISSNRGLLTTWNKLPEEIAYEEYIQKLNDNLKTIIDASQKHQRTIVQRRLKKQPEHPTEFQVGEYVLISYPDGNIPDKLTPVWKGPFVITERNHNTYTCQDMLTQKTTPVFVDRLKSYTHDGSMDIKDVALPDRDEYVVDRIIEFTGDPKKKRSLSFKVRWQNELSDDSWLPWEQVRDLAALDVFISDKPHLQKFFKERVSVPHPPKSYKRQKRN